MRYDYPYFINNIAQLLQWFDKEKKEKTGVGLAKNKYPICGGQIKRLIKKENITLKDFKTVLWGVMNEKEKVYSPYYAKYCLNDLERYKEIKKQYEEYQNKKNDDKEVDFNKEHIEEEKDSGEEFFDDI